MKRVPLILRNAPRILYPWASCSCWPESAKPCGEPAHWALVCDGKLNPGPMICRHCATRVCRDLNRLGDVGLWQLARVRRDGPGRLLDGECFTDQWTKRFQEASK